MAGTNVMVLFALGLLSLAIGAMSTPIGPNGQNAPPGAERPISVESQEVKDYVQKGLKKYSAGYQGPNEPMIVEVVRATQQTVAGSLYRITAKIGESGCPKGSVVTDTCLLVANKPVKNCEIQVFYQSWTNVEDITVTCD